MKQASYLRRFQIFLHHLIGLTSLDFFNTTRGLPFANHLYISKINLVMFSRCNCKEEYLFYCIASVTDCAVLTCIYTGEDVHVRMSHVCSVILSRIIPDHSDVYVTSLWRQVTSQWLHNTDCSHTCRREKIESNFSQLIFVYFAVLNTFYLFNYYFATDVILRVSECKTRTLPLHAKSCRRWRFRSVKHIQYMEMLKYPSRLL